MSGSGSLKWSPRCVPFILEVGAGSDVLLVLLVLLSWACSRSKVGKVWSLLSLHNSGSTDHMFYSFTNVYMHCRHLGSLSGGWWGGSDLEIRIERAFRLEVPTSAGMWHQAVLWLRAGEPKPLTVEIMFAKGSQSEGIWLKGRVAFLWQRSWPRIRLIRIIFTTVDFEKRN